MNTRTHVTRSEVVVVVVEEVAEGVFSVPHPHLTRGQCACAVAAWMAAGAVSVLILFRRAAQ